MNDLTGKRPWPITTICVLAFLFIAITLITLIAIPTSRALLGQMNGELIPLLLSLVSLVALVGYWRMRKWGVYLYTLAAVMGLAYSLATNVFNGVSSLIAPIIVIGIGLLYFKRMS